VQQRPFDYRRVLAGNVRALMEANNWRRDSIPAYYVSGPKRGSRVSGRTIGYILDGTGPSATLDVIAAIAYACKPPLMVWQLFVPNFDPRNPPYLVLTDDERALYAKLQELRDALLKTSK
jgi:hypothetical protein